MLIARADLVKAISLDSQARMTTDPNRPVRLGSGNGVLVTFDTPFTEATSLKGYVDGVLVPGTTLKMATGTNGVDQIEFPSPPTSGKIVAVSADGLAINVTNLDEAQEDAENRMEGSVTAAGYSWPVTGAALRMVTPEIVREVKEILRLRRDLDVSRNGSGRTPQEQWRYDVTTGKIPLPPGTAKNTDSDETLSEEDGTWGSDEPVFEGEDWGSE